MHAGKEEVEAEVAEATATANPSTSGGDEEFDWEEEEDEEADEGEEGEAVSADDEPRELTADAARLGFGRIVVLEIEAPNMLVNLV